MFKKILLEFIELDTLVKRILKLKYTLGKYLKFGKIFNTQ